MLYCEDWVPEKSTNPPPPTPVKQKAGMRIIVSLARTTSLRALGKADLLSELHLRIIQIIYVISPPSSVGRAQGP